MLCQVIVLFFVENQHNYPIKSAKRLFFIFFSGRKLDWEKVILSDFVLRKAKRAYAMRRATSGNAFKMLCRDRRMDRGARLGVNQGEAEGPVSAEAPPWQGAIIKSYNYHSQGMSKAQGARNAAERGLRKIDRNRRVRSTSGEAALPPPQGDFLEKSRRSLFFMGQLCKKITVV